MTMADVPEGSVIITPAEVYSKVVELTTVVTELVASDKSEEKDRLRIEGRLDDHGKEIDALKAEVGSVKQKLWFIAGIASASGAGVGSILAPYLVR